MFLYENYEYIEKPMGDRFLSEKVKLKSVFNKIILQTALNTIYN